MLYVKNLPTWERALRLAAAVMLGLCAFHFRTGHAGIVFGVLSLTALLTAVFGFCPACALAGRKLDRAAASRPS